MNGTDSITAAIASDNLPRLASDNLVVSLRECLEIVTHHCPAECLEDACADPLCAGYGCMHAKAQRARDAIGDAITGALSCIVKRVPAVPGTPR